MAFFQDFFSTYFLKGDPKKFHHETISYVALSIFLKASSSIQASSIATRVNMPKNDEVLLKF